MGGKSVVAGKPHRPIYDLARVALEHAGHVPETKRILAIGDGPETDLAGANRIGVDAFFVAGGILFGHMEGDSPDSEAVARALVQYGVSARWYAAKLVWSDR